jgi:hypothetical protein
VNNRIYNDLPYRGYGGYYRNHHLATLSQIRII